MSSIKKHIQAFAKLGNYLQLLSAYLQKDIPKEKLSHFSAQNQNAFLEANKEIIAYLEQPSAYNPWFTNDFVLQAIQAIAESLNQQNITEWINKYSDKLAQQSQVKVIGVVMAGNIPLVGFHDYIGVLITGNHLLAKLSHDDNRLLPLLHKVVGAIEPEIQNKAAFTSETLKDFDAIIATGSDNTSRYFDYYFGKYPHIIRKNRNGIAVLNGNEKPAELESLATDIFSYFGLGCRNVSKLFVPEGYNFEPLLNAFKVYEYIGQHSKYANNYDYNKSIYLINKIPFYDTGFVLLKEDAQFSSPISVLYFEYYNNTLDLENQLLLKKDKIQCLVSNQRFQKLQNLNFGTAQQPHLWEYADGVDTIDFLLGL